MAAGWRAVGGRLPAPATVPTMHSHTVTLTLAAVAATAALAPAGALARPIQERGASVKAPSQELRSSDARDAADGRGTFNSPQVVVVKAQPRSAPANGIDWADAGIGAGGLLGMSVIALGGTLLITHRRRTAHDTVPAGL